MMLLEKLQEDLRQAQLARDEVKVSTLRLLLSEINNAQIAKTQAAKEVVLSEPDIISVIRREVKKRKESIESFTSGGREDLAQREERELNILQAYLPAQMSQEELTKVVEEVINEMGASSMQDMGRVMSGVMSKVAGRVDGGTVSVLVKEKLSR